MFYDCFHLFFFYFLFYFHFLFQNGKEIDIKKQGTSTYAFIQYFDILSVVKGMRKLDGENLGANRMKLGFGKSMPTICVWMHGITDSISEKCLMRQCSRFGPVTSITIDRERGKCLVFYDNVDSAQIAVTDLKGRLINGKRIQVDFASRECQNLFFEKLEASGQTVAGDKPWERRGVNNSSNISNTNTNSISTNSISNINTNNSISNPNVNSNSNISINNSNPNSSVNSSINNWNELDEIRNVNYDTTSNSSLNSSSSNRNQHRYEGSRTSRSSLFRGPSSPPPPPPPSSHSIQRSQSSQFSSRNARFQDNFNERRSRIFDSSESYNQESDDGYCDDIRDSYSYSNSRNRDYSESRGHNYSPLRMSSNSCESPYKDRYQDGRISPYPCNSRDKLDDYHSKER